MTNKFATKCDNCGRVMLPHEGQRHLGRWIHPGNCVLDQRNAARSMVTQFIVICGDIERATTPEDIAWHTKTLLAWAAECSKALRERL